MARVVFWILLAGLAVWWLRRLTQERRAPPPEPPAALPREMVACALCQVHLPAEEAVRGGLGRLYCCEAHRRSDEA